MDTIFQKIKLAFNDHVLRRRILFTLFGLVIFRILASVPIPNVNTAQLVQFFQNNQLFGLVNVFSGGGLSNLSIVLLGVGPYITASIIMQLMTFVSEKMKRMYQEEGDAGRKKFSQYSRLISVPLAVVQAIAFLILLERQGLVFHESMFGFISNVIIVTAGSVLLMWVGELITEFGIGNGVSLIITSGIIASLPGYIATFAFSFDKTQLPMYALFVAIALITILFVVFITEAERPIPVTYAKRVRGNRVYGGVSTYIPLRLNQAGVIPIIFALSLLLFPQMVLQFVSTTFSHPTVSLISETLLRYLANNWVYAGGYFLLVFVFTYFYTAVTFDPKQIAENLQKNGAFVPGVRPGISTAEYIGKIVTRITLVGALFLGLIAVLPLILRAVSGIQVFAIGGTGLLIVVSTVIDLVKKVDAQVSMREY